MGAGQPACGWTRGNDGFTLSDTTNIEYVLAVPRHGLARAGVAVSRAHFWTSGVPALRHVPLPARATAVGRAPTRSGSTRRRRSACPCRWHAHGLVIWTTTTWTSGGGERRAAAVKPDAEYGRRENGEWVAVALYPDKEFEERPPGSASSWRYSGPSTRCRRRRRRASRDPVGQGHLDQGPGIVHIRPAVAARTPSSRTYTTCRADAVDDRALSNEYGWLHGPSTVEGDRDVGNLGERGLLAAAETYAHQDPHCWRCDTRSSPGWRQTG